MVIFVLLALGGVYYWWAYRNIESTDDAYTDGRAIIIAPQVSGDVISLDVTDNQFVKKGQPLIHIDPRQYQIDREQAEGALATAKLNSPGSNMASRSPARIFPPSSIRRRPSSPPPRRPSPRRRPITTAKKRCRSRRPRSRMSMRRRRR